MKNSKLSKSAETLLNYFRTFPAGEPITATHKELGITLNCNEKTIRRSLKQLEELDYLCIESGKEQGSPNLYFLKCPTPSKNVRPETNVLSENDVPETNVLCENCTTPATLVNKDFTPKADAVLKRFTPPLFQKNAWVIPYSNAVSVIAQMSGEEKEMDTITNTLKITRKEVILFLEKFNELSGTLGINTHKLLVAGLACFANTNHIGTSKEGENSLTPPKYKISFSEKEYALLCGYDVKEHPASTLEEAENEKNRVKMIMDNFRKQVKKDLNILSHARINFSEKKQSRNFKNIAIIGTTGIQKGYIEMTFDVAFIEYILQIQALIQYPITLLLIDNRKANAYCIGLKISEHYYMLHNHETGTQNRLKVQTLLACTNLPAIEKVREQRQNWRTHMQEPLENALIELEKNGVISSWNYSKNGILLTDEETEHILDFETWYNLNVEYTMEKPSDLTGFIEEKKQKKRKNAKQKEKDDHDVPAIPKRKRGRPRKTES